MPLVAASSHSAMACLVSASTASSATNERKDRVQFFFFIRPWKHKNHQVTIRSGGIIIQLIIVLSFLAERSQNN
jgi:hypothetical protein